MFFALVMFMMRPADRNRQGDEKPSGSNNGNHPPPPPDVSTWVRFFCVLHTKSRFYSQPPFTLFEKKNRKFKLSANYSLYIHRSLLLSLPFSITKINCLLQAKTKRIKQNKKIYLISHFFACCWLFHFSKSLNRFHSSLSTPLGHAISCSATKSSAWKIFKYFFYF